MLMRLMLSILLLLSVVKMGILWAAQPDVASPVLAASDPAKAKRAKEFWEMGNAYEGKGLTQKAKEYWKIAEELDPHISKMNGNPGVSSTVDTSTDATLVDRIPDFNSDPDQPYNNMVKNFYEKALSSYSRGDIQQALNYLKKAEELDSAQPQVLAFLDKIQSPPEKPADPLKKIREALSNGKNEEALAKLDDYLDQNPDDQGALELKDKIEGRTHSHKTTQKPSQKAQKAHVEKTPIAQSDQDRQAEADQAYNLGLDSYRQGDYAAAKKFWKETLEIQPTKLQARRNLDRLLEEHPELK